MEKNLVRFRRTSNFSFPNFVGSDWIGFWC